MTLQEILDHQLFDLRGIPVTVGALLTALVIMAASFLASWIIRRAVNGVFERRGMRGSSSVEVTTRLIHYAVVLVGFTVALDTLGFSLGALFAAGAVFAVAIGFAMQNIAQNFVSGVILLVERSIKPGDVIQVENTVVRVEDMGIRTTIVRTRDDERLIVPNALLVQGMVKNYTLRDSLYRLRARVGVVYSSDLDVVLRTLRSVAEKLEWRNRNKKPRVLLAGFGDSSVDFDVSVWMDDPWEAPSTTSDLHLAIWSALHEQGVTIAFPQLDVHFDPEVSTSLRRITESAA